MPNENESVDSKKDQEELDPTKTNQDDKFVQELEKKEDEDDEAYQTRLKEAAIKRHQSANELYARISKIDKKIDELKPQPEPKKEIKKTNQEQALSEETILEKTILLSKGLEMSDLKLLSDIQKIRSMNGENKTLTELQDDPLFKANVLERKAKKEEENASLPPSRGGKPLARTPDFTNKETGRLDMVAYNKWVKERIAKGE